MRDLDGLRRDDLGEDRDRGLLGAARAEVEADGRSEAGDRVIGDPRLAEGADATLVRAARPEGSDEAGLRQERLAEHGEIEAIVVAEDA